MKPVIHKEPHREKQNEPLEELSYDEMNPEQQALHDEILSGPRSRIGGPMNGWFRNPEIGSLIQKVGAYCRYHTTLEPKLSELAPLNFDKGPRFILLNFFIIINYQS